MSTVETTGLKKDVEKWREILVITDSVLGWEKEWYPAVTSGLLTSVFLLLWYEEPSCLTLLAIMGLVATLLDYAVPRLQDKIFPESAWTGDKEKRLDQFCQNMMFVKSCARRVGEVLRQYRETAPITFVSGVVVSLYLLAYLGTLFSGFFLAYILLLVVCMIPGLQRRGLLRKYCAGSLLKLEDFVKAKKLE